MLSFFIATTFILIIAVIIYVIGSLITYKLFKLESLENSWLAWIPIFSYINIFEMIKKEKIDFFSAFQLDKKTSLWIYIILSILLGILDLGQLEIVICVIQILFTIAIFNNLLSEWNSPNELLYSVLTWFIYPLGIYLIYNERKINKSNITPGQVDNNNEI